VSTFEQSSRGRQSYDYFIAVRDPVLVFQALTPKQPHPSVRRIGRRRTSMNSPYGLPAECLTCHLRSDDFFCALSRATLDAFNEIKHAAVFPAGVVIFVEGQTPRGVFMLCQGKAKLCTTSRDGKALILRIAKPGEVFGLDAIVTGKPYQVTVQTMQPCQANFVNREDFLRSSTSTATPVCVQSSRSAATASMHMMWCGQLDCLIQSPAESRNSCSHRRPTSLPRMELFE
jgi:CRP-like cAMP-binding protein